MEETAENTSKQIEPTTWSELLEQHPELEGMPEMVEPCDFSVQQSADFEITLTYVQQQYQQLNPSEHDTDEQTLKFVGSYADITLATERFLRTVCKKPQQFDTWNKGKRMLDMYNRLTTMLNFVISELGK